ncbi:MULTISPECIES: colicin-like pore-forming protein [unclassified Serratia (in: enterobacteria)]|uniref:colicin-like pore-forming protein n=1 Tax=unclassified Serratia (in: enterobacteria) TaxID=2647522 RepID=UPI002ED16E20|nr:colicin-like pore-forming protein [Serratia sp. C2(2)]MEE4449882.1 colicin-like pore-forming protein [Serratia sp. C2(1)]
MGGFNYGNQGDGTSWSSESGDGSGGSHGTGGGKNDGNGSNSASWSTMNPGDKIKTPWGTLIINGQGQATMNGLVMTERNSSWVDYSGGSMRILDSLLRDKPPAGRNTSNSPNQGPHQASPGHPNVADGGQLEGDNKDKHKYYSRVGSATYSVLVDKNGNVSYVSFESGKESGNMSSRNYDKNKAGDQVREYVKDEKDFLMDASGIIADAGEKISNHIGGQFKSYADEIVNNIRNFQGRSIRSYRDALASFNNVMSNPSMKVNQGDKEAIINAMRSVNAQDMANRLGHFGKFFKAADIVMKIEKIREKSIDGYKTGNWAPLMYEVESMVLSGLAGAVALGFVTSVLSAFALPVTVAVALAVAFSIAIAYGASFIDAGLVARFNNEVVRQAH